VTTNKAGRPGLRRALTGAATALAAALALGGCVEAAGDIAASPEGASQFVRRPDASMGGATLSIMSVEGAPDEFAQRFDQSLDAAAAERQIALVPPTSAKYLVRGYLSASLATDGATIDFVWDVFTPGRWSLRRRSTASPPNAPTTSRPICPIRPRPRRAGRSATRSDAGPSRPPLRQRAAIVF